MVATEHRATSETRAVRRTRGKLSRNERLGNQLSSCLSLFLVFALQPRPKKAINRYPSEVIPSLAFYVHTRPTPGSVHARAELRAVLDSLSRLAEWVMRPAKARGRQMNYDISFSRPYVYICIRASARAPTGCISATER